VANTLLGMTFTLSLNKVQKDCQEVNSREPSQREGNTAYLKLLKDVPKQLVSAVPSAVLKQRLLSFIKALLKCFCSGAKLD
jgi:hypothetical protein